MMTLDKGRGGNPSALTEERRFWPAARHAVHFMGMCGAGKTTLSKRLVDRCCRDGGAAVGTMDWDPHVADQERIAERAFRRDLDEAIIKTPEDAAVRREIMRHSLEMVEAWRATDANLIVVDRFIESYDQIDAQDRRLVQDALAAAGFSVTQVLLMVGGIRETHLESVVLRVEHTRRHRPESWWASGPASAELWAEGEVRCQSSYLDYCRASPFPTLMLDTTGMHWRLYEDTIVHQLVTGWSNLHCLDSQASHRHGFPSYGGFSWFATLPGAKALHVRDEGSQH